MQKICYWLASTEYNCDDDMIIYTEENYEEGDVVTVDGRLWRVIMKDDEL